MTRYLILSLLMWGCSHTASQNLDPDTIFRKDARVIINRQECVGICVVPRANSYNVKIKSKGRMDDLATRTCSRERTLKEAGYRERLTFRPDGVFEGVGDYCPLRIDSLEKIKHRHSFSLIVFKHPRFSLQARIVCNGDKYLYSGVGVCQVRSGMYAHIKFDNPVISENNCGGTSLSGQDIRFNIRRGECVYTFADTRTKELFRLVTFGYDEIIHGDL